MVEVPIIHLKPEEDVSGNFTRRFCATCKDGCKTTQEWAKWFDLGGANKT